MATGKLRREEGEEGGERREGERGRRKYRSKLLADLDNNCLYSQYLLCYAQSKNVGFSTVYLLLGKCVDGYMVYGCIH